MLLINHSALTLHVTPIYDLTFNPYLCENGENLICWYSTLQVFVANPNKTPAILGILHKNQSKLVEFLSAFHTDRTEDEQFNDEKAYLIKQIKELQSDPQS